MEALKPRFLIDVLNGIQVFEPPRTPFRRPKTLTNRPWTSSGASSRPGKETSESEAPQKSFVAGRPAGGARFRALDPGNGTAIIYRYRERDTRVYIYIFIQICSNTRMGQCQHLAALNNEMKSIESQINLNENH